MLVPFFFQWLSFYEYIRLHNVFLLQKFEEEKTLFISEIKNIQYWTYQNLCKNCEIEKADNWTLEVSIDFSVKPLSSSMALAVPSARLAQSCCQVSLPYYEGYNRFAVWPAPNSVSKMYPNLG